MFLCGFTVSYRTSRVAYPCKCAVVSKNTILLKMCVLSYSINAVGCSTRVHLPQPPSCTVASGLVSIGKAFVTQPPQTHPIPSHPSIPLSRIFRFPNWTVSQMAPNPSPWSIYIEHGVPFGTQTRYRETPGVLEHPLKGSRILHDLPEALTD